MWVFLKILKYVSVSPSIPWHIRCKLQVRYFGFWEASFQYNVSFKYRTLKPAGISCFFWASDAQFRQCLMGSSQLQPPLYGVWIWSGTPPMAQWLLALSCFLVLTQTFPATRISIRNPVAHLPCNMGSRSISASQKAQMLHTAKSLHFIQAQKLLAKRCK